MRRLLSLLLASTMILVACGNANNENKKKEDEKKSEVKKEATKNKVKSRLLCKMLYNVFTISTYQN